MAWRIEVSETAEKQLGKLDRQVAQRFVSFLRERVAVLDDLRSTGAPLTRGALGTFWKYRGGDWRLICEIRDHEILIVVLAVGKRREVYR